MSALWHLHLYVVAGLLLLILVNELINLRAFRRLDRYPPARHLPRISVLVPARNEALHLEACLARLLAQDYPDYEVLVLDDESTDATAAIAYAAAERARSERPDVSVGVLTGRPLPPGWFGKHWACWQLAQAADGDLLLFCDADTRLHPLALRDAAAAQEAENADLLSALPHEETVSWAERLVIPIISWAFLCLLPMGPARRLRAPALSAAIGQFMLFRRSAYDLVGGHAAVRDDVVDDMALARRIKAAGLRWRLLDAKARVTCRMYRDAEEVVEGFSKNIFPALGYRVWALGVVYAVIGILFFEPLGLLALHLAGMPLAAPAVVAVAVASGAGLITWIVSHLRFGHPWYAALLYPITLAAILSIATRSMILTISGRATWKDRVLARPRS